MATAAAKKTAAPTRAAKKTAPTAKKAASAPTRKTATPAPAKKTASAPKSASKPSSKPANPDNDEDASDAAVDAFTAQVFSMIKNGVFDHCFSGLLDVIEDREKQMAEMVRAKKTTKPAPTKATVTKDDGKNVPLPTRKKVSLTVGTVYALDEKAVPKLAGATIKFLGYKDGDDTKAKGEIVKEVSGAPTGKKVLVPSAALVVIQKRTRRSAK